MTVECPACHARSRLVQKAFPPGARLRCPSCSHVFPLGATPAASPPAAVPLPAALPAAEALATILVVDDSPFFREMLLDLLRPLGFPCLTAGSAAEAWELLVQGGVGLLILDINLPDRNGAEFLRMLRGEARFARLPVLAISGVYRREQETSAVLRAGADDFLSKSFRPEEFCQRVSKLLGIP